MPSSDNSLVVVVDYLAARVAQLKTVCEELKEENDQLKDAISSAPQAVATPPTTGLSSNEQSVLEAAREVSAALLQPLGSRPDLDIKGSSLKNAIRNGDVDKVRALLVKDPAMLKFRSLSVKETFGFTTLHFAADLGKDAVCEALIELGMNPLATDILGRTPLHLASSKLHIKTVEALIRHMDGDYKGEKAPQDLSGVTPAGYSALSRTLHKDISRNIDSIDRRKEALGMLHERGDACISPFLTRKTSKKKRSFASTVFVQQNVSDQRKGDLTFGSTSIPGFRVDMEDSLCVAFELGKNKDMSLFAVFDGHGGKEVAKYCATNICRVLQSMEQVSSGAAAQDPDALSEALRQTLKLLDAEMASQERFQPREKVVRDAVGDEPALIETYFLDNSGSTATLAVVTPTFIVVANLGDSRTLLMENDRLVLATRDHAKPKPEADQSWWEEEVERIREAGGNVDANGRVLYSTEEMSRGDSLAMSRAMGDFEFKQTNPPIVIVEPEMYQFNRVPGQYIILATDGIWDAIENEPCKEMVLDLWKNKSPDEVCHEVAMACINSNDNISIIAVQVNEPHTQDPQIPEPLVLQQSQPEPGPQRNLQSEFEQAFASV